MRRLFVSIVILFMAGFASCARTNSKMAVESAIQNHLHENAHLMLNSFKTRFEDVTVKGETANALVRYQSKELPRLVVHVRYVLRLEQGQWRVITSSTDAFDRTNPANPHAGAQLDQMAPPQSLPGPVASH
jgi:hypothetical protein